MNHPPNPLRLTEAETFQVAEAVAEAEIRGVGSVTVLLACDGDDAQRRPHIRSALTVYHDPLGFQRLALDWSRLQAVAS